MINLPYATISEVSPSFKDVARISQQLSAAEGLLLAKTLLDGLVTEEIDELSAESNSSEDEAVAREREAYIALHPTLFKQYPDEYVAIYQGQLVDHDKEAYALSLRIHQRFPDAFVWIAPVKAQVLEEWVVRSPRFEPMAT